MTAHEPAAGVIEGQTLKADQEWSADVCIVGSGAGGAVAAHTLAAKGLKVVVLEDGGYFTANRFRMLEADCWPQLFQSSGASSTKDARILYLQGRAVGGSTTVNWTTSFRLPARTHAHWTRHHEVGGFSTAELAPHFDAVEERLGIAEIDKALVNRNNQLLWNGCEKIGLKPDLIKRNVRGCAHTGFCGYGCPINAKQSMLVTYLPDAMNAGATVVSRCRVDKLRMEAGKVAAIEGTFLDAEGLKPTGHKAVVRAKRFILSAGAIGTPGILLRSGAPDPHERTGLRTFLHPVLVTTSTYDEEVKAYYGAPQSVSCHSKIDRGDELGYFLECMPMQPTFGAMATGLFGGEHTKRMLELPNRALHIGLLADGFHEGSPGGRVELHPSGRPVLDYPITSALVRGGLDALRTLCKVGFAAGAKRMHVPTYPSVDLLSPSEVDEKLSDSAVSEDEFTVASAHQMGGAGMSDNPKKGVVRSEDLRHHQLDNLHVIDGSVFPTSLGVNPQESVYGLSRLISTRLAQAWT